MQKQYFILNPIVFVLHVNDSIHCRLFYHFYNRLHSLGRFPEQHRYQHRVLHDQHLRWHFVHCYCHSQSATLLSSTTVTTCPVAASSSVIVIRPLAIAAGFAAVALGARAAAVARNNRQLALQQEERVLQQIDQFLSLDAAESDNDQSTGSKVASTPQRFVHSGDDSSVRFAMDGRCYPLLRRGPCSYPFHWVTVDPVALKSDNVYINILYISYTFTS